MRRNLKLGTASNSLTPFRLTGGGKAGRGAGGKIRWQGANAAYAPAGEILIEDKGAIKHVAHIRSAADIPAAYILIEGNGAKKHALHILNAADIPVADILIEGIGTIKHEIHILNAAGIPTADILIEGSSARKHAVHNHNAAGAASSGEAIVRHDLGSRPFGIFGSTHCTCIANCGIGTENGHPIAMEGKEQPTVIFAFSIYWRVARIAASATLYITIALRAALDWRSVGAGIGRASTASISTASIAVITIRKAKCCCEEQDREGTEKVEEVAGFCGKKARGAFFTI